MAIPAPNEPDPSEPGGQAPGERQPGSGPSANGHGPAWPGRGVAHANGHQQPGEPPALDGPADDDGETAATSRVSNSARVVRPRAGKGLFVRTLESAERDGEACRLHAQGWPIRKIAAHLGYPNPGNCHRGIQRALAETASLHGGRELRESMMTEIAEVRRKMWELIESPPPLVDRYGNVVVDSATGEQVPDAAAMTNAATVVLRAQDRLAKLAGLDAARKSISLVGELPIADLQARLAELKAQEPGPLMITGTVEPGPGTAEPDGGKDGPDL